MRSGVSTRPSGLPLTAQIVDLWNCRNIVPGTVAFNNGRCHRLDSADILFYPSSMPVLGVLVLGQKRWVTLIGALMYCGFVSGMLVPAKVSWCRTIFGPSRRLRSH